MRLVLHIGRPKTASSTIQRFLAEAASALSQRDHFVPNFLGRDNHRLLVTLVNHQFGEDDVAFIRRDLRAKADRDLFMRRVEKRLRSWLASLRPSATIMMSCEQLSSFETHKVERLHEFFADYCSEFQIVIYIRRQDLTYVSRYNTKILSNGNVLYSEPFSFPSTAPDNLLYGKLLDRWSATFGRKQIQVRCLDPEYLVGGSVVLDFCTATGLNPNGLPMDLAAQNESVSAAMLEFVRRINARLQSEKLNKYEITRIARITHNIGKISSFMGSRLRPARAEAEGFLSLFDEHNAHVARTFLGREKLFSGDFSMYPETHTSLSEEDTLTAAVEFVATLLKQPGVKF